ncbi:MAG: hypothetical protein C0592_00540 [Marinilabiliales bacterium]|nr:MAG: hypothetical protein C0592_00540 [Marinilabiliales bacterium]
MRIDMDSPNKHIVKMRRKESWWFHTIRGLNMFFFRFWYLMLLFFAAFITLWIIYCLPAIKNTDPCADYKELIQITERINDILDNCCECQEEQPEEIIVPDTTGTPCNSAEFMNGGQGEFTKDYYLGTEPGTVTVTFDMYSIPDKMEIIYNGQVVASTTNFVSGVGVLSFYYPARPGEPQFCTIRLSAPYDGTSWEYYINCPE